MTVFLIFVFLVLLICLYDVADNASRDAKGLNGFIFSLIKFLIVGIPTFYVGMVIFKRLNL